MDSGGQSNGSDARDTIHYPKVVLVTGACRFLGGYLTARLAPQRPVTHALALGIAGLALSVAGAIVNVTHPEMGPLWYPLVLILIAIPTAWVGGKIRSRQLASF